MIRGVAGIVVSVLSLACGAEPRLERFEYREVHMGTEARIVLYAPDSASAEAGAAAAFERIAELDRALSDYRGDSEISQLAARAGSEPMSASADLLGVLRASLALAEETGGAFDPTVGPVTRLWRRARRLGELPDPDSLRDARALVAWRNVEVDTVAGTVRLAQPGMSLDLGGIAKGFGVDEALAVLRSRGLGRALISLGGEIVAGDAPPGESAWPVQVENADPSIASIALANVAVSSSGDTEQFLERDGVRYSHVIDPRSGQALTHRVAATVIARDALTADALATAVTLLESEERERFTARHREASFHLRSSGAKRVR
jgi:thiamine biosynthesis lipoprotein